MFFNTSSSRLSHLTLATVIFTGLQACATSEQQNRAMRDTGVGAIVGALAGAALGKGTGSDHVGRDAAIGAVVGGIGGYVWNQQMEKQRQDMQKATQGTDIHVERTANNELKIDIPSDAGFVVNQSTVEPRLQQVLNTFSETLKTNATTRVHIIGHTDTSGTDAVNTPLSLRRADSTRDYLRGKGVAANRMSTEGKGSAQPIAENTTDAGRRKNRRVEIFVTQSAS